MILTDSNGREPTSDSIMNHFPKAERGKCETSVIPAYSTEEALHRVTTRNIDVDDAVMIRPEQAH